MTGEDELLRLAALMKVSAHTARRIADVRGEDRLEIYDLAERTDEIASAFEQISRRGYETGDLN